MSTHDASERHQADGMDLGSSASPEQVAHVEHDLDPAAVLPDKMGTTPSGDSEVPAARMDSNDADLVIVQLMALKHDLARREPKYNNDVRIWNKQQEALKQEKTRLDNESKRLAKAKFKLEKLQTELEEGGYRRYEGGADDLVPAAEQGVVPAMRAEKGRARKSGPAQDGSGSSDKKRARRASTRAGQGN